MVVVVVVVVVRAVFSSFNTDKKTLVSFIDGLVTWQRDQS